VDQILSLDFDDAAIGDGYLEDIGSEVSERVRTGFMRMRSSKAGSGRSKR
jgi:hypothetical protein